MRQQLVSCVLAVFACWGMAQAQDPGQPTPEALGTQFDAQVNRLVECGYPELFGNQALFDKEMHRLREEAVKYRPAKQGYTFLVVVPENCAPYIWQIQRVKLPFVVTFTAYELDSIRIPGFALTSRAPCVAFYQLTEGEPRDRHNYGAFTTPDKPYLIYDVDGGEDTANHWDCDVALEFGKAHRRGLTVEECAALLIQRPELLATETGVVALGTMLGGNNNERGEFLYWSWTVPSLAPGRPEGHTWTETRGSLNDPLGRPDQRKFKFPSCKE